MTIACSPGARSFWPAAPRGLSRRLRRAALAALVVGVLLPGLGTALIPSAAHAQEQEGEDAPLSPPDANSAKADAVLTAMSDFLAAQPGFSFRAASFFDLDKNGDLVKRFVVHTVKLKRPNKVYFRSVFDDGNILEGWYDGKQYTLVRPLQKTYSVLDYTGTVDDFVQYMQERFNIRLPLADVIYSNFMEQHDPFIIDTTYLGDRSIEDKHLDQVLVELQDADWQIWITSGAQPVPVRFLTTYLRPASRPEYMATFYDWKFGAGPDTDYTGKVPTGFSKTEFGQN